MFAVTPELAIKIIFDVIAIVTGFYGTVHVVFYKLGLPGFKGKWALNLAITLLVVAAVLLAVSYVLF